MDDFNLEESGINSKSKAMTNVRNLNKEFDMIKNDKDSDDIESFRDD